jgi:toxin CcdB
MQCDVYRNLDDPTGEIPYLLDIQSNLLDELKTRVVVPLVRTEGFGRRAERLHPVFRINDGDVVMATHLMAAITTRSLKEPVASLADQRDTILSAVDVVWSGV